MRSAIALSYENKDIGLIIRGVMITQFGYRYFIQVGESDNSFTLDDDDMDEMIEFKSESS